MNLKKVLKSLKLNESTISMVLGAIVIVVVGVLVINYFKGLDEGSTIPSIETAQDPSLPTTHIVKEGEDLWGISEKYYGTGFNWVDIAEANNISSPNLIEEGQTLQIPDVDTRLAEADKTDAGSRESLSEEIKSETAVSEQGITDEANDKQEISRPEEIIGNRYTVQKGDTLWDIAERAYGDAYQWVSIAKANKLVNPNLIHPGNVFVLPGR